MALSDDQKVEVLKMAVELAKLVYAGLPENSPARNQANVATMVVQPIYADLVNVVS